MLSAHLTLEPSILDYGAWLVRPFRGRRLSRLSSFMEVSTFRSLALTTLEFAVGGGTLHTATWQLERQPPNPP